MARCGERSLHGGRTPTIARPLLHSDPGPPVEHGLVRRRSRLDGPAFEGPFVALLRLDAAGELEYACGAAERILQLAAARQHAAGKACRDGALIEGHRAGTARRANGDDASAIVDAQALCVPNQMLNTAHAAYVAKALPGRR